MKEVEADYYIHDALPRYMSSLLAQLFPELQIPVSAARASQILSIAKLQLPIVPLQQKPRYFHFPPPPPHSLSPTLYSIPATPTIPTTSPTHPTAPLLAAPPLNVWIGGEGVVVAMVVPLLEAVGGVPLPVPTGGGTDADVPVALTLGVVPGTGNEAPVSG